MHYVDLLLLLGSKSSIVCGIFGIDCDCTCYTPSVFPIFHVVRAILRFINSYTV